MEESRALPKKDSSLDSYYASIRRIPLLDADEERELSLRIAEGDESARCKLIEANLRLVIKIARAYVTQDMPLLDLIQEGNLGLIRAAEKYDGSRMVRFSTYASWWIKQTITRSLVNSRRAIRLPHRKEELLRRIQRAYSFLSQKLQREPNDQEIADEVHASLPAVAEMRAHSGSMVSLEGTLEDEGGVIDVFEDNRYSPDEEILRDYDRLETLALLQMLVEKERRIIAWRFELGDSGKRTLKMIGEELGISPETVRQIEKRALRKLRCRLDEVESAHAS